MPLPSRYARYVATVAAILAAGCGGRSSTAPSQSTAGSAASTSVSCAVTVPAGEIAKTIGPGAIAIPLAFSTDAGCAWTAVATGDFLTIASASTGNGPATLDVRVAQNAGEERAGSIAVGTVTFTITQRAAALVSCAFGVTPQEPSVPSTGGTVTFAVSVTEGSGCPWNASASDSFLTIASGASGDGDGAVVLTVAPNGGSSRTGSVSIAGRTVRVSQEGSTSSACAFIVEPTSADVPAAGGVVSIAVNATAGVDCAWSATPVDPFVTITGSASGTGSGTVKLSILPNTGAMRSGSAMIAGHTIGINQAAVAPSACVFAVTPASTTLPVEGGTVSVTVTVTQGTSCAWTSTIAGAGITILSGGSGTGNGTVVLSVATNPGTARTGGVIIAGTLITIVQPEAPGACVFAVTPTSFDITRAGQSVSFDVTVTKGSIADCSWSVGTGDPSIGHVTSITSAGNRATVVFAISENAGRLDRIVSAVAAGILVTVHQAGSLPLGPCLYSVTQTSVTAPATASSVTIVARLEQGSLFSCSWSIVPIAPFITVASAVPLPDSDGGTIVLTIAANLGAARTGTIQIAGHTVTVSQAGMDPVLEESFGEPQETDWSTSGAGAGSGLDSLTSVRRAAPAHAP